MTITMLHRDNPEQSAHDAWDRLYHIMLHARGNTGECLDCAVSSAGGDCNHPADWSRMVAFVFSRTRWEHCDPFGDGMLPLSDLSADGREVVFELGLSGDVRNRLIAFCKRRPAGDWVVESVSMEWRTLDYGDWHSTMHEEQDSLRAIAAAMLGVDFYPYSNDAPWGKGG